MRIVSLFSGAGGLDLGLIRAGHDVVWANDIFLDAAETYRLNIGDHIDTRDIREVSVSQVPDCDVIVGGFPCQGFSVANWTRSNDDPRNALYLEMARLIRGKQPRYFVAENVRGLLSMDRGHALRRIEAAFSEAGYEVRHALVNAADYGVPQNRHRLLIAGVHKSLKFALPFPPKPTHASPDVALFLGLDPWVTVGEALDKYPEPDDSGTIANHVCSRYKLRFNGYLGHRLVDPSKPAPTVTARGDDRGGVVVLHHPRNHRRMTVRELAAVQSFPDNFVFHGTKTSAYRQIANAVPPLLGYAIGRMLSESEALESAERIHAA